ncbi:hypothetical protein ACFLTZ_06095 [Chloroflexota bacterium]
MTIQIIIDGRSSFLQPLNMGLDARAYAIVSLKKPVTWLLRNTALSGSLGVAVETIDVM